MNTTRRACAGSIFRCLVILGAGWLAAARLPADVVVLQSGAVITGTILQQDASGVLLQMEYGTFRYPPNLVQEVRKEAAAPRHVSNNGQVIPDWAQIVSLMASHDWADGLQQVPAPMISYPLFQNIPYISFRCGAGGYEINIYGDLNQPAAVQMGAMTYLKDSMAARSNCVNFVCSLLASVDARKLVRSLDLSQKAMGTNAGMTAGTILPGEWGSYGGWWVMVYNQDALASAKASAAELLAITQSRVAGAAPGPNSTPGQPPAGTAPATTAPAQTVVTTTTTTTPYETYGYGTTYAGAAAWTAAEMNYAHPAVPVADASNPANLADANDRVYPRTYNRAGGSYGQRR